MLTIITKEEYLSWTQAANLPGLNSRPGKILARLKRRIAPARVFELKDVQDAYIRYRLRGMTGRHILEAGGGISRLLPGLAASNDCWLADRFEGSGGGPTRAPRIPGVKIVPAFIGEFDSRLPAGEFDMLFSVSVIEHVPLPKLESFFQDCARLLKPGGLMLHAIDTYLFDEQDAGTPAALAFAERTQRYLDFADRPDLGLRLLQPAALTAQPRFSCRYASLPDNVIYQWQRKRPDEKRLLGQVVSLKAEWVKLG